MDLTRQMQGKEVAHVATNGRTLHIRMTDGAEIVVGWVDDNGVPIAGKPVVERRGFRLNARGLRDIIASPQAAR